MSQPEMRALDLCLECGNALEIITVDPVVTPGKRYPQEVECVRLSRHWPACKAERDVFSSESPCDKMIAGSPLKVFPTFRIVEPLKTKP